MTPSESPVLILGTGIAGLTTALKLARHARVTLVAKADAMEGSTRYAQGGIASVWSQEDSFESHLQDTLTAGGGLTHESIARICVTEGPARVQELIDWGTKFTLDHSAERPDQEIRYDLHREGGHSERRILHADDLTGLEIERALLAQVRANPKIKLLEHCVAIDLITEGKVLKNFRRPGRALGAYVLDTKTGEVRCLRAEVTVLATGGAGKVYLYTTNPDTATGDGVAMAYRAGARIANMEFIQFHPTCLYSPQNRTFLITEALRGEGAILVDGAGRDFVKDYHPLGSLAPRDVVARAIDAEMKRTGAANVWLDTPKLNAEDLRSKFPNIVETCLKVGIDPTLKPIPVVPGCHYTCGGVRVDHDGRTSIDGLYAVGEVACTGLHGANRLASNSLLEAVVFAERLANHAVGYLNTPHADAKTPPPLPEWDIGTAVELEEQIDISSLWLEIRTLMWNYVGIVRSDARLDRARRRLEFLKSEIDASYWNFILTKDLIELRNLHTVAELIVICAQSRKESRGLHFTADYPLKDDVHFGQDTTI